MNEKTTIDVNKVPRITKFIYTLGVLPTSYLMSMTYEEQLVWLCNYIQQTLIPAINTNVEAVKELQELYELLRTYVNEYFDNLDVQEEINNKLDEMSKSGQLADIIAQYLELSSVLAFNTISDLKNADNIINGSICRCLGQNLYNDGKGSYYKIRTITSSDIVDEINIVSLNFSNTLIAERIYNKLLYITPEYFGCIGDGITDDTESFRNCIEFAQENNYIITSNKNKTYLINETIDISNISLNLNNATIKTNENIDIFEINEEENNKYMFINNINFDMNNIGISAIKITNGRRNKFYNINIINTKNYGIKILNGYENLFNNINIQNVISNPNTGTIGFLIETADSNFDNITMTNISTSFHLKRGGNYFNSCHSWVANDLLIDESIMFLIELSYSESLFLNNCYNDTLRYFIKYNNNIHGVIHVNNLLSIFNNVYYTSNHNDTFIIYCNTDDQTRFLNINNSTIAGLSYSTGAKSYLTNRTDFFGKMNLTNISGTQYKSEYEFTDTSSNLNLTINSIKKDNNTVNINVVGNYNSSGINQNTVFNLGKLIYELLPKAAISCFECVVSDTRWDSSTGIPCRLYIPTRNKANDPITVILPNGTGTKYIFINLTYII